MLQAFETFELGLHTERIKPPGLAAQLTDGYKLAHVSSPCISGLAPRKIIGKGHEISNNVAF